MVLSDTGIFSYKVDNYYDKVSDSGIAFDDKTLGIDWRLKPNQQLFGTLNCLYLWMQNILNILKICMNNILVTGGSGQLGSSIKKLAPKFSAYNFFLQI